MRLYRLLIGGILAAVVSTLLPSVTAYAIGANLIGNPSAETAQGSGPASWTFDKWGTNTTTSAWKDGAAKDGTKSLAVTTTAWTSGDAKWMAAPVSVKPSTKYVVSDWYIGTVTTSLEVVYTTSAGKQTFVWLTDAPVSASWKQLSIEFTTPANAVKASVYHVLAKKGSLQTDLYFLAESGAATPTPTPASVTLTAPAEGATVTGTQQLAATASSDVIGVKFAVDGVAVGAEDTTAPFTASWDTTKATNAVHTVTATARTATSATAATTKVTVTVNNSSTTPPPPPPTTPGNLIGNPSVETASGTAPAGWTSSSWGTNTTAFTYLTTGHTGSRSVKTQITQYTSGDAKWSPAAVAVTPGKTLQYSNYYQSNVDSEVDVEVTMADGSEQYAYLATAPASSAWAKVGAQYTVPAGATKITVFQVLDKVGWITADDFSLAEYAPAQLNRALISLTFDDGWRTQYTAGVPLLDKYKIPATYYLLTSTIDYPDYMSKTQMGDLPNHGVEIASHTVDHPHLPTLTAAQIDSELKDSQASLRQWYGAGVAKNFATPYGEYNATVLSTSKKYYRSHRSTDEGYNTKDSTDVNNIKVQNILDTTTPAQVGLWIDQAIKDRSWLVLVYHEVSATAEDPTYAVTPANLEAELKLVQSKGITALSVDKALDEVVPQLP